MDGSEKQMPISLQKRKAASGVHSQDSKSGRKGLAMTFQNTGLFSSNFLATRRAHPIRDKRILRGLRHSALAEKALPQSRGLHRGAEYLNRCVIFESIGDRPAMEDAHYASPCCPSSDRPALPLKTNVFAVIDGCGGHEGGDLAGKIAAQLTRDAHQSARFFEPPFWTRASSSLPLGNLALHRFLADRLLLHLENVNDAILCLSLPGLDLSDMHNALEMQLPAVLALQRSWKGNLPLTKAFRAAIERGEEFPEGPKAAAAFCLSYGNLIVCANIGDCRSWRFVRNLDKAGFRGECLSLDDTLYGAEYALKICNAAPVDDAGGTSGLTRALGCLDTKQWLRQDPRERLYFRYLSPTDIVLLCSDGFYGRFWAEHGFYPTDHLAGIIASSHSHNVRENLATAWASQPKLLYRNDEEMQLDNSTMLLAQTYGWY